MGCHGGNDRSCPSCACSKSLSSESGTSILELSLGLPVFILLMASFADGVTLGYNHVTLAYAAQQGLRKGIEGPTIDDPNYIERAQRESEGAAKSFGVELSNTDVEEFRRGELGKYLRVIVTKKVPLFMLAERTLRVDAEGLLDSSE